MGDNSYSIDLDFSDDTGSVVWESSEDLLKSISEEMEKMENQEIDLRSLDNPYLKAHF